MAEKRASTLLEFAVAAAAAVVPVLLLVLVMVGVAHPIAPSAAPARNADRHVSVRHLAALKTFERADRAQEIGPGGSAVGDPASRPRSAMPPRMGWPRRHARSRAPRARAPRRDAAVARPASCGAACRSRRGAAALFHRRQSARERGGRLRLGALVRRGGDRDAGSDRGSRLPGTQVHRPMRRHRERRDDARALERTHARRAFVARHRSRARDGALASGAVRRGERAAGRARESVARAAGLHLHGELGARRQRARARVLRHVGARAGRTGVRAPRDVQRSRQRSRGVAARRARGPRDRRPSSRTTSGGRFRLRSTHWCNRLRRCANLRARCIGCTPRPRRRRTPRRPAIATDPIASRSAGRRSTSGSPSTSRSTPRYRRSRRRRSRATPVARTSAARSGSRGMKTPAARLAPQCSRRRWCAWPRSR